MKKISFLISIASSLCAMQDADLTKWDYQYCKEKIKKLKRVHPAVFVHGTVATVAGAAALADIFYFESGTLFATFSVEAGLSIWNGYTIYRQTKCVKSLNEIESSLPILKKNDSGSAKKIKYRSRLQAIKRENEQNLSLFHLLGNVIGAIYQVPQLDPEYEGENLSKYMCRASFFYNLLSSVSLVWYAQTIEDKIDTLESKI